MCYSELTDDDKAIRKANELGKNEPGECSRNWDLNFFERLFRDNPSVFAEFYDEDARDAAVNFLVKNLKKLRILRNKG